MLITKLYLSNFRINTKIIKDKSRKLKHPKFNKEKNILYTKFSILILKTQKYKY